MKITQNTNIKFLPLRKRYTITFCNNKSNQLLKNHSSYHSSQPNIDSDLNAPTNQVKSNIKNVRIIFKHNNEKTDGAPISIVNNSSDSETSSTNNSPNRVNDSPTLHVKNEKLDSPVYKHSSNYSNDDSTDSGIVVIKNNEQVKVEQGFSKDSRSSLFHSYKFEEEENEKSNTKDLEDEEEEEENEELEDEDDEEEQDEEYEDCSKLYCICRKPYNANLPMIACDKCNEWFHMKCVSITSSEAKRIKTYICPLCQKEKQERAHIIKPSKKRKQRIKSNKELIFHNNVLGDQCSKIQKSNKMNFIHPTKSFDLTNKISNVSIDPSLYQKKKINRSHNTRQTNDKLHFHSYKANQSDHSPLFVKHNDNCFINQPQHTIKIPNNSFS